MQLLNFILQFKINLNNISKVKCQSPSCYQDQPEYLWLIWFVKECLDTLEKHKKMTTNQNIKIYIPRNITERKLLFISAPQNQVGSVCLQIQMICCTVKTHEQLPLLLCVL